MKNKKQLESFIVYCKANPEQRFWQALRNWSGSNFIYKSKILLPIMSGVEDTFYEE